MENPIPFTKFLLKNDTYTFCSIAKTRLHQMAMLENASWLGSHIPAITLYSGRISVHFFGDPFCCSLPLRPVNFLAEHFCHILTRLNSSLERNSLIRRFLWLYSIIALTHIFTWFGRWRWFLCEVGFLLVQIWGTKVWGSDIGLSAKIGR